MLVSGIEIAGDSASFRVVAMLAQVMTKKPVDRTGIRYAGCPQSLPTTRLARCEREDAISE